MDNRGITKKQFRTTLMIYCLYVLMGVNWLIMGIAAIIVLIVQRKHHLVENPAQSLSNATAPSAVIVPDMPYVPIRGTSR